MVFCSVYRELIPATGVEACAAARFTSLDRICVAVGRAQQLDIYSVVVDTSEEKPRQRLVLQFSFRFHANVVSVESFRYGEVETECFGVSFSDAKVAILKYDPATNSVATEALCNFEDEALKKGLFASRTLPDLCIEPSHACAAMPVYMDQIAVIPLRSMQLEIESDDEGGAAVDDDEPSVIVPPSFVLDADDISADIANIRNMVFLQGYYGPTLAILYEPRPTSVGRAVALSDTYCLAAVSLDLLQQSHPTTIWSIEHLPSSCLYMHPVPKPIGGVLLVSTNAISHIGHASSVLNVFVNKNATLHTSFDFGRPQHSDSLNISLDGSHITFIDSHRFLLVMREGDSFVVRIEAHNTLVSQLTFDRCMIRTFPSCVTTLPDSPLVFVGSRLADSLLCSITEQSEDATSSKRAKVQSQQSELDEIYGAYFDDEWHRAPVSATVSFDVNDFLPNIGPVSDFTTADLLGDHNMPTDPEGRPMALTTCSGLNQSGSLYMLSKQLLHQTVSADSLPGSRDVWSLATLTDMTCASRQRALTRCVIIAFDDSTTVLDSAEQLQELTESGFASDETSIYACALPSGHFVQVTPKSLRLVEHKKLSLRHSLPVDGEETIVAGAHAGSYIVLRTSSNTLLIAEERKGKLAWLPLPPHLSSPTISCVTAFEDLFSQFVIRTKPAAVAETKPRTRAPKSAAPDTKHVAWVDGQEWDEVDEALYAEGEKKKTAANVAKRNIAAMECQDEKGRAEATHTPTFWFVIGRLSGQLEVFSLPSMDLVHCSTGASKGEHVLVDAESEASTGDATQAAAYLTEIKMVRMGAPLSPTVYLFARNQDGDLWAYLMFSPSVPDEGTARLAVRFGRVPLQLVARDSVSQKRQNEYRFDSIRPFENVNGYSGVYVCGASPVWLVQTERGGLRLHPARAAVPVWAFAPFNTPSGPYGFITLDTTDTFNVCKLPEGVMLEMPWLTRRVPLRRTPYFVTYNRDLLHYVVATSKRVPFVKPLLPDQEPEAAEAPADDTSMKPELQRFSIDLISPMKNFETIDTLELREYERVLSLKTLRLNSQQTQSGKKSFICVGTGLLRSANIISNGRLLVFELITVVPDPDHPELAVKLKLVFEKEYKGPVTAVAEVAGQLALGVGQQVWIHSYDDGDHQPIAFLDGQPYATQLLGIKNYLLIGDFSKSIWFARFRDAPYNGLDVLGRDCRQLRVTAVEYLVDHSNLYFVVTDEAKNVHVFTYAPQRVESANGQRLLHLADFHLGSLVQRLVRLPMATSNKVTQHMVIAATVDGSVGTLLPLVEMRFRRLQLLQRKLNSASSRPACLNARGFRLEKRVRAASSNRNKNLLDAELLWEFVLLSSTQQRELANQIGSTVQQILEDLYDMDKSVTL